MRCVWTAHPNATLAALYPQVTHERKRLQLPTLMPILQKEANNPDSGKLESGYGVPIGPDAASILRRYEFYEFSGMYDPETHEAKFEPPDGDSNPGPNDVGTYLGSQNAAANLVPEPHGMALAAAGLGFVGCMAIRRRRMCR